MVRSVCRSLVLVGLCGLTPAAGAAEFAEAGEPWPERKPQLEQPEQQNVIDDQNSLAGIYALALYNDHNLAAARATYRAGLEARDLGRAELLPHINASYGLSDRHQETRGRFPAGGQTFPANTDSDSESWNWRVGLEQPLFDVPAWFRFQRGQELSREAASRFTVAQQDLIVRTVESYFAVLRARANLQASNAEESALKAQLDQVQQRFDVGLVAITDVNEAQAAYDLAVANRLSDAGALRVALEQLSVLTGQSHSRLWRLREAFPVVAPTPDSVNAWARFARQHNEDIEVARYARRAAKKSARVAQTQHLPKVDLSVNYSDQNSDINQNDLVSGNVAVFPNDQKQNQIALNVTLPVFSGGQLSATRRQARAQFESEAQTYAATVREVRQQTRARYISVVRDVARTRARQKAIVSSRSALEAAQTGYEVGTRNVVDVLDAQQRLYSAIRDHANSIIDYVQDVVTLKRRAGNLTPADVQALNRWLEVPPPPSKNGTGRSNGLLSLPPRPGAQSETGGAGGGAPETGRDDGGERTGTAEPVS